MSVNKFIGIGRVVDNIDIKSTKTGLSFTSFSIAINEKFKNKNGELTEKVEYVRIVVFGKIAELCNQYLGKGRQAFIEGKLQARSWEDKDGNKRYTTEILASTVQFLEGQSDGQASSFSGNQEPTIAQDATFASDDIPF